MQTCGNVLQLPNYWEALLKSQPTPRGRTAAGYPDHNEALRLELRRILVSKLTIAIHEFSGCAREQNLVQCMCDCSVRCRYGLDEGVRSSGVDVADLIMKSLLPSEAYGASEGEEVEWLSDDGCGVGSEVLDTSPSATQGKRTWVSTVLPMDRNDGDSSDDSPMLAPNTQNQRTGSFSESTQPRSRASFQARLNGNSKEECWAE